MEFFREPLAFFACIVYNIYSVGEYTIPKSVRVHHRNTF